MSDDVTDAVEAQVVADVEAQVIEPVKTDLEKVEAWIKQMAVEAPHHYQEMFHNFLLRNLHRLGL